jgi:hypothetical protein
MRSLCIALAVMIAALTLGCGSRGEKVTHYGNLLFFGKGQCNTVKISGNPWPADVTIECSDGTKIDASTSTHERISELFGAPIERLKDRFGVYEKYKRAGCHISYQNDAFDTLFGYSGVVVINTKTGKSVTLPATESEIHAAFGRPTKVTYASKMSP